MGKADRLPIEQDDKGVYHISPYRSDLNTLLSARKVLSKFTRGAKVTDEKDVHDMCHAGDDVLTSILAVLEPEPTGPADDGSNPMEANT